jgi:hypothetical protein
MASPDATKASFHLLCGHTYHLPGFDFRQPSPRFLPPRFFDLRIDPAMTRQHNAIYQLGHDIRWQLASLLNDFI